MLLRKKFFSLGFLITGLAGATVAFQNCSGEFKSASSGSSLSSESPGPSINGAQCVPRLSAKTIAEKASHAYGQGPLRIAEDLAAMSTIPRDEELVALFDNDCLKKSTGGSFLAALARSKGLMPQSELLRIRSG